MINSLETRSFAIFSHSNIFVVSQVKWEMSGLRKKNDDPTGNMLKQKHYIFTGCNKMNAHIRNACILWSEKLMQRLGELY